MPHHQEWLSDFLNQVHSGICKLICIKIPSFNANEMRDLDVELWIWPATMRCLLDASFFVHVIYIDSSHASKKWLMRGLRYSETFCWF